MRMTTYAIGVLVVIGLFLLGSALFIIDERQRGLVLQFGQIKSVKTEPGLYLKVPFIQNVVRYDDRILALDSPPIEVTPADDRRLVVDAFARYRIDDVVQFRQAVGLGGVRAAENRLASLLNARIREVLGSEGVTSDRILSEDRRELADRIRDTARENALDLGLDVVDVRLKQTNLPQQNLEATFARMRAEREREAADEVARGREAAQRIRAGADRTSVEITSDAERQAQVIRGEADAKRNNIFADAYGADREFFRFYRSMNAYTESLRGGNTSLVISPKSAFFDYLESPEASRADNAGAPAE